MMIRATSLHTIGRPHVPDFADPLGLMSHCHRKIEGYLKGMMAAGEMLRGGRGRDVDEAFRLIDAARQHFTARGPKHTQDEETSLFPRLREHGGGEAEDALSALAELEGEHRAAERVHAGFDSLIDRLPHDGSAPAEDLDRYAELVAALESIYRPHILVEDEIVFPVAARVIPTGVLAMIGREMRERRRDIFRGTVNIAMVTVRH
jgi:hemerythrin-like domain-containing protein